MREDDLATDLIGDYLEALWKHILETTYKARGKVVIEAMAFHVVITLPAIWKNYARQIMEEAARKARIFTTRPAGPTTLALLPSQKQQRWQLSAKGDDVLMSETCS